MDCMDDIVSNFRGYCAGLVKGYRAVFEMSCRVVTAASVGGTSSSDGTADDLHSPSHGAVKGFLVSGSATANDAGS
ncbi:hypothetical protein E2562_001339 [Oryza meyeriana var. granulata]|uniref:Uncharacterized protein n=1 Tax=Oryza meyeriana var. granulata TaxID=110450 RepID=A0A6G1DCX3_9ORYZ|nr:hypothetical protein E2562_001339 [Oryza meyeriana var. granulata]